MPGRSHYIWGNEAMWLRKRATMADIVMVRDSRAQPEPWKMWNELLGITLTPRAKGITGRQFTLKFEKVLRKLSNTVPACLIGIRSHTPHISVNSKSARVSLAGPRSDCWAVCRVYLGTRSLSFYNSPCRWSQCQKKRAREWFGWPNWVHALVCFMPLTWDSVP